MTTTLDIRLEWIPVRNLAVVWPEAQRLYNERRAKKIAAEFDPDRFDPIRVTLPNGNGIYHVIDGQKRARALEMKYGPDERAPCFVADASTPKRAAELFLESNSKQNRQDVNAIDNFLVALTAERKDEISISRIVRHNGYRVDNTHAQDTIAAVEALRFGYGKGKATLDQTLHTLRNTWGSDHAAVASTLIKGYSTFICEFSDHIDWKRLYEVVKKKWTPGQLLAEAKGLKEQLGGTTADMVVHLLLTWYNRGLRTGKPLKRKE